MPLPVKGGYVTRGAALIILTSNKHPDDWYPAATAQCMAALRRRYSRVEHMTTDWLPPPPMIDVPPVDVDPVPAHLAIPILECDEIMDCGYWPED